MHHQAWLSQVVIVRRVGELVWVGLALLASLSGCGDTVSGAGPGPGDTTTRADIRVCEGAIAQGEVDPLTLTHVEVLTRAALNARLVDPKDRVLFKHASGPFLRCEFEREDADGRLNLAVAADTGSSTWLLPIPDWAKSGPNSRSP